MNSEFPHKKLGQRSLPTVTKNTFIKLQDGTANAVSTFLIS